MELPQRLRVAIDKLLEGTPTSSLQSASAALSQRYRAELRDGRLHLADDLSVKAYLAARMPATFAAIRSSLAMLEQALPAFSPRSILDVGSGPGTGLWAAQDCWPELAKADALEASDAASRVGRHLAQELHLLQVQWHSGDAAQTLSSMSAADLVTLCYVLDELPPESLPALIRHLWKLASFALVIVEPGTPAGWARILTARTILIESGAHIAAPCPHEGRCPLSPPDWCHFARRVARTRIHRVTKGGDVPWEDEKFIFLAATRSPPDERFSRVIAPPKHAKGRVDLKLCDSNGNADFRTITKREGESFRVARRADWGDALDLI
ncbi:MULTISPECIES: small ribosomal subunit Rsm22 family protein [Mesorhizobium]|uniref:Methyltransferase domain-containing protein n=1 Tax=Mesorhizobium denitrificans TaxID=2294114 RepID=A0A371XIR2_9HYPH|nr:MULTISPECIES: small ribosomal subunit Rsm22 family protein [Mesorhizobium]RFC69107.1 methyltransferase domain-containing protein [Mesorhizobium denitrificans]